jgi:hypothetical protein
VSLYNPVMCPSHGAAVYEGDQLRAEQAKRVEQEVKQVNAQPGTPEGDTEKESSEMREKTD